MKYELTGEFIVFQSPAFNSELMLNYQVILFTCHWILLTSEKTMP